MFGDLHERTRVVEVVVEEYMDVLVAAKDLVYSSCFPLASGIHILNVGASYLLQEGRMEVSK